MSKGNGKRSTGGLILDDTYFLHRRSVADLDTHSVSAK